MRENEDGQHLLKTKKSETLTTNNQETQRNAKIRPLEAHPQPKIGQNTMKTQYINPEIAPTNKMNE